MRFLVMDQTGHKQLDFTELEAAQERFNELIKDGYRAACSNGDGTHDLIKSFDEANQADLIFIPHLRGG